MRSVNVLAASLLHDILEDTETTTEEFISNFGNRIYQTVMEVTNDPKLSSDENKQRQVDHAPSMSLDAQLVKLADRLYNIQDLRNPPPSWDSLKVQQYLQWGDKLLKALPGTNEELERALASEIQALKLK
ncbi:MAG: guanosine-3,5-bis(diphosphate) 3-pyrophosphohydrolase [Chlamydiales bacterium]|nr:guanosine-3,5-bis(diphosphate) 3-pyrophosphohydrolase [Chlamydiales bacterium]